MASGERGRGRITGIFSLWAYAVAALAEIPGCFAFWAWLRLGKSAWWILPGAAALIVFAGRAYAAYGGVYIAASLLWLVEGARSDRWNLAGGLICLIGAAIILLGPRTA